MFLIWRTAVNILFLLIFFKKILFGYAGSSLQYVGSSVFIVPCRIYFPDQGSNPTPFMGTWSLSSWTCEHSYTWPICTVGFIPRIESVGHEQLYLAKYLSEVVMPVYMCTSSVSLSTCRTKQSFSFYPFWMVCSHITS